MTGGGARASGGWGWQSKWEAGLEGLLARQGVGEDLNGGSGVLAQVGPLLLEDPQVVEGLPEEVGPEGLRLALTRGLQQLGEEPGGGPGGGPGGLAMG